MCPVWTDMWVWDTFRHNKQSYGYAFGGGAERKRDTQMSISHTDRLCVCVWGGVTLLQPFLYVKGNMKPMHVRRTVSNIRPLWNCRDKMSYCQHLLRIANNDHVFISDCSTWNQTLCPQTVVSGQSGLKYLAIITPVLTVVIQPMSMNAATHTEKGQT